MTDPPPFLIDAAKRGDEDAWRMLFEWLAPKLAGYAWSKGLPDPEDLVGDVFSVLAQRLASFDGDATRLRSFAFSIAHNRIADHYRRAANHREVSVSDPQLLGRSYDPMDEMTADLTMRRLADQLPADQRDVVLLYAFGRLRLTEIAEVLGKSPGSVRMLHHRARQTIKELLREEARR